MKTQHNISCFMRKHDLLAVTFVLLTAFLWLLFPNCVHAAEADTGIIAEIVNEFYSQSSEIATVVKQYALKLFGLAATLEVAFLGVRAALGQAEIGETLKNFTISVIAAGFFLAVINNYQDWSNSVITGLQAIAGQVNTIENSSDNPFKMGLDIAANLLAAIENLSWDDIPAAFGLIICALVVFITFCLITAQIIFIKCEAYIAMASACLLVGLGATSFFRDYAINVLKYIVSVAFKLMVMQLVIGIGYTYISKLPSQSSGSTADLSTGLTAVGVAVVLLALVRSLPDTVAGIINGSHIGSGGLASAVRSVALGTMATSMAMAATAKNINYAHKAASGQGADGVLSHAGRMASNLYSSWRESAHGKEGTSMGNSLRQRIAASEAPSIKGS